MFVAVLGLVVLAGAAAAQSPPPQPLPPIVPVAAPAALPGSTIAQVMPISGGLNGPATLANDGVRGVVTQPPVSYGMYAPGCNNGCGNFKHDLGFMFGSCKSFFDPCGPRPCGGFGRGHGHGRCGGLFGAYCPDTPYGTPYGRGHNGCVYDSWLNH